MDSVPEEFPEEFPEETEETEVTLVRGVREGDVDAVLVLWRRYSARARTCAGQHVAGLDEVDHVLRTAFARVVRDIASDDDPAAPFLLSLCLSVESEAGVLGEGGLSDHPLVLAFQMLRRSYQTLLWHAAVEPLPASALAAVLGREEAELPAMTRHAVGLLRSEWVAETVADPSVGDSCAWVLLRVDAAAAGILGRLSAQRYERHLRGCSWCRATVGELDQPLEVLRRLISSATETSGSTSGPRAGLVADLRSLGRAESLGPREAGGADPTTISPEPPGSGRVR